MGANGGHADDDYDDADNDDDEKIKTKFTARHLGE